MAVPIITPLPVPPVRGDAPADFAAKADAFVAALVPFVGQVNSSAAFVDGRASAADISAAASAGSATTADQSRIDAQLARDTAQAVANFKGAWSSLSGPLNIPATVLHKDQIWLLLQSLASVSASEPGITADWLVQGGIDASKTTDFTASRNAAYWIGSSLTVTLPDTTTPPPKGTFVRLTKALTAKPVIQAGAGSAVIVTSKGNDTSVIFDINAEVIVVWNGAGWEV